MSFDPEHPPLSGPGKRYAFNLRGLAGKIVGTAVGAVGLILAAMFSLVLLTALLGAVIVFGGYFWWKTRALRQQMREAHLRAQAGREQNGGHVVGLTIEGRSVRQPDDL
ncbi:MAG: hypothetical protein ABI593_08265 [Betaproteobacteria bacterium]